MERMINGENIINNPLPISGKLLHAHEMLSNDSLYMATYIDISPYTTLYKTYVF